MKILYIAVQCDEQLEQRLAQVVEEVRSGTSNCLASNPHEMWDFEVSDTEEKFPSLADFVRRCNLETE